MRPIPTFALAGLLAALLAQPSPAQDDHVTRMAQEHRHDNAAPSPATSPEPAQPVVTEEVTYATLDGTTIHGTLVRPQKSAGPLPGILVIQEWWGLNDNVRAMAKRFAGEGYVTLAVDLYEGKSANDPEKARELMQAAMARPERLRDNLRQARRYLAEKAHATKIGVVGWCFGGGWSLETALDQPAGIDAAIMYYGRTQTDLKELAKLRAPLLGLFGGKDQGIPIDGVRQMEAALATLGKDATIVVYPDADHAFANPSGRNYQAGPAEDAWKRSVAFFGAHLKPGN